MLITENNENQIPFTRNSEGRDEEYPENKVPKSEVFDIQKDEQIQIQLEKIKRKSSDDFHNDDADFNQNMGIFSQFFFLNLLSMAIKIKRVIQAKIPLKLNHLPSLPTNFQVEDYSNLFYSKLEAEKEKLNQKIPNQQNKMSILMRCYKKEILTIYLIGMIDVTCKMFTSVALNFCIQAVIDQDYKKSYGWSAGLVTGMLLQSHLKHHSWSKGMDLNSRLRLVIVNTLYKKISNLTSHSIKEANVGKVINLVSSDLNSTEAKFFFLFSIALAPYSLSLGCIILAFRLGPLGLLSIAMLILVFPLQKMFGKMQSKYFQARATKSDERVKLINESIDGIRLIKMYGWENVFKDIITKIRKFEKTALGNGQFLLYIEKAISTTSVLLIGSITFIIIYFQGSYELNSAKIFSTIEILQYLKGNVMMFSGIGIGYIFELQIFLGRFLDIFYIKENEMVGSQDAQTTYQSIQPDEFARFHNFNAYWKLKSNNQTLYSNMTDQSLIIQEKNPQFLESSELQQIIRPTLRNVTLQVKKGELIGVVGKIGSGKSTLLQCFLKEIPYYEGYFEVQKQREGIQQLAYVEQEPYIFSNTVRENILFGKEYDEKWYEVVVKNCSLLPDFKEMEQGDMTLIGEKGVNISGGQKARISLARSIYSNADVYLLDDPLSAVDSKVAKILFNDCVRGVLKDKTVILVTHQIHFTKNCDRIFVLEDGEVKNVGKFEDLEVDLKKLAAGAIKFENKSEEEEEKKIIKPVVQEIEKKIVKFNEKVKVKEDSLDVSISTYKRFSQIISSSIFCFPLIVLILFVAAELAFTTFNRSLGYFDETSEANIRKLFGFWIGLSFLYMFFNAIKYNIIARGVLIGSGKMHNKMFESLVRAPVLFFDTVPSGTLMNKFSNDVNIVDNVLHYSWNDSLDIMANFLNLMITCCVINPYVVIPVVIELIFLFSFLSWMKDIIIQTKQIDLINKTPVYSFFQSTLSGVVPIKIYNQKQNFLRKMEELCNNSVRTNAIFYLIGRFFGAYVQNIAIIGSGIGIFLIVSLSSSNPSLAAQSLTYFCIMIDAIQWCLRQILNIDSVMSSCERIFTVMDQAPEADLVTGYDKQNQLVAIDDKKDDIKNILKQDSKPLNSWPKTGNLKFNNVVMRYSPELSLVLKGLSFEIQSGQKVGCIGRTGAGKSSLLSALFRMSECEPGSKIIFDGIDISKLGLHTLRQKISIIPQMPFVFAGTIRRNIDPLELHSDEQIWKALKIVELDQYVRDRCTNGLLTDMSNVASVFSAGQKQLICLARAVLKDNKLIVLDEATANVDMETDNLIQKTIRSRFQHSSVLTIAHRLNTIADYDKVIVMDDGKVVECDEPFKLLANSIEDQSITRNTLFAQMVEHTGKNNAINIFHLAKAKYEETQHEL